MSATKHEVLVTTGVSDWAELNGLTWVYPFIVGGRIQFPQGFMLVVRLYRETCTFLNGDLEVLLEGFSYNGAGIITDLPPEGYVEVWFMDNTILFPSEH